MSGSAPGVHVHGPLRDLLRTDSLCEDRGERLVIVGHYEEVNASEVVALLDIICVYV